MSITLMDSLGNRAIKRSGAAFEGLNSLADWEGQRPAVRRDFGEALGLDLLGGRCAPAVIDCGEFSGEGFSARKIGFQILPDCWTSAMIYYPEPRPAGRMPGVLYVCGHGQVGTQHYQAQPILWARRGYVCLIVDTIAQSDNPGSHSSFLSGRSDLWLSLGYNSGGGEALNSLRALDILAADPAVDEDRLGVTGISGGGALSFYVAALDERVKAVSTLCGVSPPVDAIVNRRLHNHCDCMYPYFMHGRDLSEYAALIAPRAAMFCFGDHDSLFCADETSAMVERTAKVYDLYGVGGKCRLVTHPCGHETHPVFNEATQKWFDEHVSGQQHPVLEKVISAIPERTLAVFNGTPPQPNRLHMLAELVRPRGVLPLPEDESALAETRQRVVRQLRLLRAATPAPPFAEINVWDSKGVCHRRHRGNVEGVDIWLDTIRSHSCEKRIVLSIAQPQEWSRNAYARAVMALNPNETACATLEHRLAGCNSADRQPPAFPVGSRLVPTDTLMKRSMALLGDTPVSVMVNDLRPAVDYLIASPEFADYKIFLFGVGEGAVAALYYAIADERISGLVLESMPGSHAEGAPLIGALNTLDIPHAVGLVAPRKVALVEQGHANWTWPQRTFGRLDCEQNFVMAPDRREAFRSVLG